MTHTYKTYRTLRDREGNTIEFGVSSTDENWVRQKAGLPPKASPAVAPALPVAPDTIIIEKVMTPQEAERCLQQIRDKTAELKDLVYELWSREGWRALGYDSFHACIQDRMGKSASTLYRLKDVKEFELMLLERGEDEQAKSSHVREYRKLPDANTQFQAYQRAREIAQQEGKKQPTAENAREAVVQVQNELAIQNSPYRLIEHQWRTAVLTVHQALRMVRLLDAVQTPLRASVLTLMGKHGLTDPELIPLMARDLARQNTQDPSRVMQELLETGCVNGVPLKDAKARDYHQAKRASQWERRQEQEEAERRKKIREGHWVPEPVILTIYKGDMPRTLRELRRALGDNQYERLRDAILAE
jgi:hypothetical protein